jgi:bacteriorhodopsin
MEWLQWTFWGIAAICMLLAVASLFVHVREYP